MLAKIHLQPSDLDGQKYASMVEHLSRHHLPTWEMGKMAAAARVKEVVITHIVPTDPSPVQAENLRQGIMPHFKGTITIAHDLNKF